MSRIRRSSRAGATRALRPVVVLLLTMVALVAASLPASSDDGSNGPGGDRPGVDAHGGKGGTGTYQNPLVPRVAGQDGVQSCADPTVLHGQQPGDSYWYMYCTTDPLGDNDRDANGAFRFHRIPTMRSLDLVNWDYVGDAFSALPNWAAPTAALWAPDVVYSKEFGQYYMFMVVTDTADQISGEPGCGGDNAIGVATAPSPVGPWTFSDAPVVAPRRGGTGCNFRWTFDPEIPGDQAVDGTPFYYGSYYGGIFGDRLTFTSTGAQTAGQGVQVAIDNKYEGADVVQHDGYYYLFVSAANCCNGALTGYSVFAGRSRDPFGPFVDREGNSLLAAQAGGTPVISMNGNRWVGTGHNTVFTDAAGQWWTVYHAVDRANPFFAAAPGFTKRPPLLDPVDWVNGWPTVRDGKWASDTRQPAPAGQPGQQSRYRPTPPRTLTPGRRLTAFSDEFTTGLGSAWSWVRPPAAGTVGTAGTVGIGLLRLPIQRAELFQDNNTASVLLRDAPRNDYVVEAKVRVDVPADGCCFNFAQAGVVIYGDDDNFVKLTNTSIWNTRQTEWAKEMSPVPAGWTRYGDSVVGPPSRDWTYLRITVERLGGKDRAAALGDTERYTAFTSQDGVRWVRGGVWTHTLGQTARIGLLAMGQQTDTAGTFNADFDYVRVSTLRSGGGGRDDD